MGNDIIGTLWLQILQTLDRTLGRVHLEDLFKTLEVLRCGNLHRGCQRYQRLRSQGFHTSSDCVGQEIVVLVLRECLVSRNVSP